MWGYEPTTAGEPAVDIRLARRHLNMPEDDASNDPLIKFYMAAAQEALVRDLECPFTTQVFTEYFDAQYPKAGVVRLHMRPVQEVISVEDGAGTPLAGHTLLHSRLTWAAGFAFPTATVVQYKAGWEPDALPTPLKLAVLMQLGDLYATRETQQIGSSIVVAINPAAERSIRSFRRYN